MTRVARFFTLGAFLVLSACAAPDPFEEDLPLMGDFRLAFNIVVADNMQQVPPSRNATPEEWETILEAEIARRFGGYQGDRLYHIALNVDGYALAPPGIPVVISPKSVLVVSANVWDDAAQAKLHAEPEQIIVFEGTSPTSVFGSGLLRSREEQMQVLARNMARRVQLWMLENPDWFSIDPDLAAAEAAAIAATVASLEPDFEPTTEVAAPAEPVERPAPAIAPPASVAAPAPVSVPSDALAPPADPDFVFECDPNVIGSCRVIP